MNSSHESQSICISDADFRHHLYDTLILLGCRQDVAGLIKRSEDGWVSDSDVDELRRYNISLLESLKTRLTEINTVSIQPESESPEQ